MGWCSATSIFDDVLQGILEPKSDKKAIIRRLITALEDMDWDCQQDSAYWDHPIVQEIMRDLHPRWFEEEE